MRDSPVSTFGGAQNVDPGLQWRGSHAARRLRKGPTAGRDQHPNPAPSTPRNVGMQRSPTLTPALVAAFGRCGRHTLCYRRRLPTAAPSCMYRAGERMQRKTPRRKQRPLFCCGFVLTLRWKCCVGCSARGSGWCARVQPSVLRPRLREAAHAGDEAAVPPPQKKTAHNAAKPCMSTA